MASPLNNATVIIHTKIFRDTTYSNGQGIFEAISPFNEIIGIDVLAKGHLFKTQMLRSDQKSTKNISINIEQALPGKSIDLNKFFFVGDRAIILDEFTPELKNLETSLKLSPEVCIEIIGHVNEPNRPPVDSTSFEFNLSVARSKLIYDIMAKKGVSHLRMCYSGKGNWDMLYPQARSAEEMKKNRRVEIVVRDCEFVQSFQNASIDLRFDFYSRPKPN
jgi:outer membrane protein OmpA-like peptidoglycan-associated protein